MLCSYRNTLPAINDVLALSKKTEKYSLTSQEKDLIEDLIEALKVFKDVSTLVQGNEFSTIGSVISCKERSESKLSRISNLKTETVRTSMIPALKRNLNHHFPINNVHKLASILDTF